MKPWQRALILTLGVVIAVWIVLQLLFRPSLEREWNPDQERLPSIVFNGDLAQITSIRNATYTSTVDYNVSWVNKTVNLSQVESVWFMVERFDAFDGLAHTLVSFGFSDGSYLAVSAEIRKEVGEHFSPLKGLLRQYELMYVIATEDDIIKLRTNYRRDDVWLYPVKSTPEQAQEMLRRMLERANELQERPEFYNTVTNTCATNIKRHVNDLSPGRIPLNWRIIFPGYVDSLVFRLELIDSNATSLEEARERFYITRKAQIAEGDFSRAIRMTQLCLCPMVEVPICNDGEILATEEYELECGITCTGPICVPELAV